MDQSQAVDPITAPFVLPDPAMLVVEYDADEDTLSLYIPDPGPAVGVDLDGDLWVRVVPNTGQVVGYEVEDFAGFRRRHPELADCLWPRFSERLAPSVITAYVAGHIASRERTSLTGG